MVGYVKVPARENEAKAAIHTWMTSASVRRNRARGYWEGQWKPVWGDEVLDLVGLCHSGACRGHSQLLGPSNPRFKRRPSLCTWSTWHPREVEKGPCATGRFRRHLDGFRHFTVHMNHNEVYICVCEAKLRPRCNMYLMRSRRNLACIIMAQGGQR